ncbi:AMP-dependent synthetase/ligase [Almyronema epifaneia]|uniref:AMP-dependent synthetase/ligase n=1 Tax=Almyronema epifaneia S1 TaxID=2991925 RepID=A0ABW6IHK6_9CYAN
MTLPSVRPLCEQEQQNLRQSVDYSAAQGIPEIWARTAERFGQIVALHDPHSQPAVKLTFAELHQKIQQFAAGLQSLGIQPGDRVAFFSDNGPRWLVADQGLMLAGAVNAVRGAQADPDELLYILEHSDSVALVVQDLATLKKLLAGVQARSLRFVVLLTDEPTPELPIKVLNFAAVMALADSASLRPVRFERDALATLMYTSGTSGKPKGVMLSHGNLLSQITAACAVVHPLPGERVLSILPIWHCYERTFEYFVLSQGCGQVYTNIRQVKKDLKQFQPRYMVGVPRLWESIYEGVQKQFREQPANKQKLVQFFLQQSHRYIYARRTLFNLNLDKLQPSLGDKLVALIQAIALWPIHQIGDRLVYKQVRAATGNQIEFVVSGGGSIAEHLEDFYEVVGIQILGGYGLTETAPITHVRRPWHNLRGADGQPVPGTETRIVNPETRQDLAVGQQGLVLLRGPQVMQGYYKNPEATAKAIDPEGWFDTGDLGKVTPQDDLIITGRAKDTIVLTNGENIEPQPIENACQRSPYIDQIMLVGQDQKMLGALIVPNLEALEQWATQQGKTLVTTATEASSHQALTFDHPSIQELYRQELNREVKGRPGYRPDERIGVFKIIREPMTVENGMMTQTLKIRRAVVMEQYRGMIDAMFS